MTGGDRDRERDRVRDRVRGGRSERGISYAASGLDGDLLRDLRSDLRGDLRSDRRDDLGDLRDDRVGEREYSERGLPESVRMCTYDGSGLRDRERPEERAAGQNRQQRAPDRCRPDGHRSHQRRLQHVGRPLPQRLAGLDVLETGGAVEQAEDVVQNKRRTICSLLYKYWLLRPRRQACPSTLLDGAYHHLTRSPHRLKSASLCIRIRRIEHVADCLLILASD